MAVCQIARAAGRSFDRRRPLEQLKPHTTAQESPGGVSLKDSGSVKELRLALVCYGGSSLAIYMHGMTKELHRLVRASSLFDAPAGSPESPSVSESVYRRLLTEMAERDAERVRTRVVVDVVAGTPREGSTASVSRRHSHTTSRSTGSATSGSNEATSTAPCRTELPATQAEDRLGRDAGTQARAFQGRPDGAVDL
jgi:hypothetical protein